MPSRLRLPMLLLLLAAAGCTPEADQGAGSAAANGGTVAPAPTQDSERTWAGVLPCSDCQGIDTRLVLRTGPGRRDYLMTETYVGGKGKNSFNRAGTWSEVQRRVGGDTETTYILDPGQASQRFSLQPDGALELLDAEGRPPAQAVAYRLQRL